jgi:hypothetical protein
MKQPGKRPNDDGTGHHADNRPAFPEKRLHDRDAVNEWAIDVAANDRCNFVCPVHAP